MQRQAVESRQQLRSVDLDRADAEEEPLTDLAVGVAQRHQADQLPLALAKVIERIGLELGQGGTQLGVDERPAGRGRLDRPAQVAIDRYTTLSEGGGRTP